MDNPDYKQYLNDNNVFQTLVEQSTSPLGLYVGPEHVIYLANNAILKVWDKDRLVVGKTFRKALPELEGQPFFDLLDQVYRTGVAYEAYGERVDLLVNGTMQKFYFNFTYQPLKHENGEVWAIMNTAADVTELVQTRLLLAENEERTRFALESAGLGTWDLDPVAGTITWDAICKKLYGFSTGDNDISYMDVLKHIHPHDRDRINQTVKDALDPARGGFYDSEFRTIGAEDGIVRWLRCKGKAYFNNEGRCIRFAGTALDITREKTSREEQNKLLKLIDYSSDFVSLSDIEGNISYVNAAGKQMMGMKSGDSVEMHNSLFLMPGEEEKLTEIKSSLLKHGQWGGEVNLRSFATGEAIPVYVTSMLIYDHLTGEPQGRATIARDLRREIADKKALVESEMLLKSITSAAPTALWMADERGHITYTNKTWLNWTGQSYEDTLGTGWLNSIFPEDRERTEKKFNADLKAQAPYEVDFRIRRKTGAVRWCLATGNPQYDANGRFTGYIGACVDITDKTIADVELQLINTELNDQIKQFEFVNDFMTVQLWTAKPNGELDYVNQRTVDYFGLPANEIASPKWLDNVHPDDQAGCIAAWTAALQTGQLYQFEFRLKSKEGPYKWHLTRALPYINDGKIVKWFGTNTDIEEQKQMLRQKDDFLGIASHELKTPVTSIKAYAQVLGSMLNKEGETKKAAMVLKMDAQLNRLTNLIGDLLDVTKINSGKIQFNKSWFDFNQAVQENIQDLQHTTNKHTLITDFKETGQIYSDKDRIGQVITNLITNAIKYSPYSDRIIISTELKDNDVLVCVQDFGIGIPEDKKDLVFEQFYRVSGSKQHTFPGLGLGLYISSEIIKREGGKMWVNSIEGKGSTFCFSLPANESSIT